MIAMEFVGGPLDGKVDYWDTLDHVPPLYSVQTVGAEAVDWKRMADPSRKFQTIDVREHCYRRDPRMPGKLIYSGEVKK